MSRFNFFKADKNGNNKHYVKKKENGGFEN